MSVCFFGLGGGEQIRELIELSDSLIATAFRAKVKSWYIFFQFHVLIWLDDNYFFL